MCWSCQGTKVWSGSRQPGLKSIGWFQITSVEVDFTCFTGSLIAFACKVRRLSKALAKSQAMLITSLTIHAMCFVSCYWPLYTIKPSGRNGVIWASLGMIASPSCGASCPLYFLDVFNVWWGCLPSLLLYTMLILCRETQYSPAYRNNVDFFLFPTFFFTLD